MPGRPLGLVPVVHAGGGARSTGHGARATPTLLSRVRTDLARRGALHGAAPEAPRRVRGAAVCWIGLRRARDDPRVASDEGSAPTPAPPPPGRDVTARPRLGRSRPFGPRVPAVLEPA